MDVQRLGITFILMLLVPLAVIHGLRSKSFDCSEMIQGLEKNMWPLVLTDELRNRYCHGTGEVIPHRDLIIASKPSIFRGPLDLKNMNPFEKLTALNTRLAHSNAYFLYRNAAIKFLADLRYNEVSPST